MRESLVDSDVCAAAMGLLGAVVTSNLDGERVSVRLTEVEAYGGVGQDPASHAFRGPTTRNTVMFGPAGHAYVYFVYGMHWCLNVVTGSEGQASAVLLRAGEVIEGVDLARSRRSAARRDHDLARGPARLASALGITSVTASDINGIDLLDPRSVVSLAWTEPSDLDAIAYSPRIGIGEEAVGMPWRFYLDADPTVSPYRRTTSH